MAAQRQSAAAQAPREQELAGEKAQRIVEAMRASVARRGAAGSTFDHVAREAGVSRGLLHYYFGTKERLLVEVVRRDCDLRLHALEASLESAHTARDFIDAMVRSLAAVVENEPESITLLYELFTLARRNEEIAVELAALGARMREALADQLRAKQREGVIELADTPEAVAAVLFALGDGLAFRMIAEPGLEARAVIRPAAKAARALLGGPV